MFTFIYSSIEIILFFKFCILLANDYMLVIQCGLISNFITTSENSECDDCRNNCDHGPPPTQTVSHENTAVKGISKNCTPDTRFGNI